MKVNRQKIAFYRKLYLAHLISGQQHNIQSLMQETKMPRRTLQDSIADFSDIAIECEFIQAGIRNNEGYYQIVSWGPINKKWISQHIEQIKSVFNT